MLIKLSTLINKYKLEINGISHFGAHLGQEVEDYKKAEVKHINLFEPQKTIFEELIKKFKKDKNVSLYNFGLGSEKNTVNLNLAPGNDGLSASILKPEDHKSYYPNIKFEGIEEIEIRTYDELELKDVNFLNIDIQGYEIEALKGCVGVLENEIDYIFIEVSRKPLYKDSALVGQIDSFLNSYNFIRVQTKWASSKVPWADSFYIKKTELTPGRILISKVKIFFQKFHIYYIFIDPYRKYEKNKYKNKQKLKKLFK